MRSGFLVAYFGPDRIFDADDAQTNQPIDHIFLVIPRRLFSYSYFMFSSLSYRPDIKWFLPLTVKCQWLENILNIPNWKYTPNQGPRIFRRFYHIMQNPILAILLCNRWCQSLLSRPIRPTNVWTAATDNYFSEGTLLNKANNINNITQSCAVLRFISDEIATCKCCALCCRLYVKAWLWIRKRRRRLMYICICILYVSH